MSKLEINIKNYPIKKKIYKGSMEETNIEICRKKITKNLGNI